MIVVILALVVNSCAGDGQYECGPNGRFEYCIDDIPGCVVGCHCYPGYYFDTDTKICEPNTKLTQDFRRHYIIDAGKDATTTEPPPARPDAAAKGNDDLSDWLYNQFYKTIENQVINKTDDEGDLIKKGTRRSNGPMLKRKKKKKRSRKGSKKASKHELRRKLLRISEDDSMFDSYSDSSSSSESSGTSSSSSWESWGPADTDSGEGPKRPHDDNKKGHRKIIIFSKKPKPPLPSFIFLPNIETPFYPPIGLPVPPLPAPMYPMIPVPPIQEPPQAGSTVPSTTNDSAPSATTSVADATTAAETTGHDATTAHSTEAPATLPVTAASGEKSDEADKPSDKDADKDANEDTWRSGRLNLLRGPARNQLLQRIKERRNKSRNMKKKGTTGKRIRKPQMNNFMDTFKNPGDFFQQPILEDNVKQEENELMPLENDVDFKYLTQLIHRVDINGTTIPTPMMNFNDNNNGQIDLMRPPMPMRLPMRPPPRPPMRPPPSMQPPLRRAPTPHRRSLHAAASQPDDTYYTRLGREIAELIRNIHADDVDTIDIDVEQESDGKASPYFSENSFAPRSYWERFVRSPIRLQQDRFSRYGKYKSSNEKLFDLESKVEIAASSSPVLSLPELENVINAMEKAQNQIHDKNKIPSNSSLNVSLLPRPREKFTNAPKQPTNPVIITNFAGRRLLNHNDLRRSSVNSARIKSSDKRPANHTNTKHARSKLGYNIQFASTRPPNTMQSTVKKNTKPPNRNYQPRPSEIPNNSYYFSNIHNKINPNFPGIGSESYKPYKESKPSYFFNEFDYFI